jgi:uncharacterized protein (UPF0332 family)
VISFDFADFLDLAEDLATGNDEAAWRSAISRAYYAVLHVAYRALPSPQQAAISHRDTHRVTWQLYAASSVQACRQVGQAGIRLRNGRVDADYRPLIAVSSADALKHVDRARQVIDLLRRHGYQP